MTLGSAWWPRICWVSPQSEIGLLPSQIALELHLLYFEHSFHTRSGFGTKSIHLVVVHGKREKWCKASLKPTLGWLRSSAARCLSECCWCFVSTWQITLTFNLPSTDTPSCTLWPVGSPQASWGLEALVQISWSSIPNKIQLGKRKSYQNFRPRVVRGIWSCAEQKWMSSAQPHTHLSHFFVMSMTLCVLPDTVMAAWFLPPFFCPADACRSWPSSAMVPELLLTQWPLQEKLLLAEHSWKKHKNTTITSKFLMDFPSRVYNQQVAVRSSQLHAETSGWSHLLLHAGNTLDILHTFASCSGFRLVFGLNALLRRAGLQWDSSNAKQLLGYCAQRSYNISWELGNGKHSHFGWGWALCTERCWWAPLPQSPTASGRSRASTSMASSWDAISSTCGSSWASTPCTDTLSCMAPTWGSPASTPSTCSEGRQGVQGPCDTIGRVAMMWSGNHGMQGCRVDAAACHQYLL